MRFRATIANAPNFFRIVQAIEKLQKKCIIKFTEREMHIICNDDANGEGIQVWSQIKVDTIFTSYRIQSNASNAITVSLHSEALLAALKPASVSAGDAEDVVVKLAKKNDQAVLSFEITGLTRVGRKLHVAHDVKIEVMKPCDVEKLSEPMCPEPDVHVMLPPLQKLRTIVDRLRPISDVLAIQANNNGRLQIAVNTDTVKLETQWTKCTNPKMAKDPLSQEKEERAASPEPDPEKLFTVLVSTRSFLKFLNSHVVSTTTIACICQNHCMILYVYVGDAQDAGGILTFYVPAIIDDGDL